MTIEELMREPKIDAHVHFIGLPENDQARFMAALKKHNMTWMTICVMGTDWKTMQKQIELANHLHSGYPERVQWAVSFNLENWGAPDWEEQTIKTIADGKQRGAAAVKIWKELGMVLKDPDGSYVRADDSRLSPVYDYVEQQDMTLVAHIGEPYNCWRPLEEMTNARSVEYYSEHPEYHGYQHPDDPGYWAQIEAFEKVLQQHPDLRVVGAHLASLEWNLDELSKRLDRYPNLAVDLAERIYNLQEFEKDKVIAFINKYQDRILYGTDQITGLGDGVDKELEKLERTYLDDYRYFATSEDVAVHWISDTTVVQGLALPAAVLRKIYYENARKWYPGLWR